MIFCQSLAKKTIKKVYALLVQFFTFPFKREMVGDAKENELNLYLIINVLSVLMIISDPF